MKDEKVTVIGFENIPKDRTPFVVVNNESGEEVGRIQKRKIDGNYFVKLGEQKFVFGSWSYSRNFLVNSEQNRILTLRRIEASHGKNFKKGNVDNRFRITGPKSL